MESELQAGNEAGASALPDFGGERLHGLLSDLAAFASGERGVRVVQCGQELDAASFAVFPESESLLHRFFLGLQATGFNSSTRERFLIGGELDFHRERVRFGGAGFKRGISG